MGPSVSPVFKVYRRATVQMLCITALALGAPDFAVGQEAAEPEVESEATPRPAAPRPAGLEEIVVTAERREEQLQKVGQAIEAFSDVELEAQGIEDIHGLSFSVPNFVVTSGLSQPSLRGVTSDVVATGVDSGLALHLNSVFVPQLAVTSIFELFDMEAVEILYGPQGTLYGRATDGGTINYKTQKPTDEWEAWADFETDTLGLFKVRGVLNLPLIDEKLFLRVAYNREWPQKNYDVKGPPGSGFSQDMETNWAGHGTVYRASLRWLATDNLTVDLFQSYVNNQSNGGLIRMFGRYAQNPTPEEYAFLTGRGDEYAAVADEFGFPLGTTPDQMSREQAEAVKGFRFGEEVADNAWYRGNGYLQTCDNAKLRAAGLGVVKAGNRTPCEQIWGDASPNPSDDWTQRLNRRHEQRYESYIGILTLTYEGENYTLTSTTNFQKLEFRLDRDNDGSDLDIWRLFAEYDENSWGQEFLFSGTYGDFDVVLGTNYTYWHQPDLRVPIFDYQMNAAAADYLILETGPSLAPASHADPKAAFGDVHTDHEAWDQKRDWFDIDTETWNHYFGVFGNVTWHVSDRFRLRGGLRYSSTRREMVDNTKLDIFVDDVALGAPGLSEALGLDPADTRYHLGLNGRFFPTDGSEYRPNNTWKMVTWEGRAEYQLTDDNLVFLRLSGAESAGGLNYWWRSGVGTSNANNSFSEELDAQTTFAIEAGSKNRFFDDRLEVNLSLFHYIYKNKLVDVPSLGVAGGPARAFDNVPESRLRGGEISITALPTPELRMYVKVGYLDSEFTDSYLMAEDQVTPGCPLGDDARIPGCGNERVIDIKGNQLSRAPEWTVNLGAEYAFQFDWGTVTPRVDWNWKDDYWIKPFQSAVSMQRAYTRTSASIRYDTPEGKYWVELYGKNLEDLTIHNQVEWETHLPSYWLYPQRHFGLKVGMNFF